MAVIGSRIESAVSRYIQSANILIKRVAFIRQREYNAELTYRCTDAASWQTKEGFYGRERALVVVSRAMA